jgi:hypothetical protein|tara:strand:- start:12233 stop:12439 length:207 start_codon:yes stop_codon:yes gene_type:complete
MAKPTQTTEIDNARRVLGMLDTVTDPEEYKKIFGVQDKDVDNMKKLILNKGKLKKKIFTKDEENNEDE